MRDAPFKLRSPFFANRFHLGPWLAFGRLRSLLFAALAAAFFLGHGLLHLFAAPGPSLGALLALLVEHLLRIDQLDVDLLRAVTALKSGANDAQVAAVAIAVPRRDRVKQPCHRFARLQK